MRISDYKNATKELNSICFELREQTKLGRAQNAVLQEMDNLKNLIESKPKKSVNILSNFTVL